MTIVETERLRLREMTPADLPALARILQDAETMRYYEGAFNDEETRAWLENQLKRYADYGFGLWAVDVKQAGDMIGQCGLSMQQAEEQELLEIGYLLRRDCWGNGYAAEAAHGVKQYAFKSLRTRRLLDRARHKLAVAPRCVAQRHDRARRVHKTLSRRRDAPHHLRRRQPNKHKR